LSHSARSPSFAFFFFFLMVLGMEPKALYMLGNHSELHPQPCQIFLFWLSFVMGSCFILLDFDPPFRDSPHVSGDRSATVPSPEAAQTNLKLGSSRSLPPK
jgi:hypothetical protein